MLSVDSSVIELVQEEKNKQQKKKKTDNLINDLLCFKTVYFLAFFLHFQLLAWHRQTYAWITIIKTVL